MSSSTPTLEVVVGDIAAEETDAIVNAANPELQGGGGVDGAIHRTAGPGLLAASLALGGCEPGEAKVTDAYSLAARYVIHAVGPRWTDGTRREAELLGRCHRRSVEIADQLGLLSISFPAISCGAYGYPPALAAPVAVGAAWGASVESNSVRVVRFVLFFEGLRRIYADAATDVGAAGRFGPPD
jgi:O-acetyl-ADP-ribose deacetylase (regulator of RNase III)